MRRLFALLVLAAFAAAPVQALGRRPPPFAHLPTSEVSVVTASGTHKFKVWIAADEQSRARGLMFVRHLPADQGMLFVFERPQMASFWMKDTPLSLDILFIASDGRVIGIARGTQPFSLAPIESTGPVTGVLEVAAGTADRLGIAAGNRVRHPAFGGGKE